MPSSEKQFIVKSLEGEEYGPADQEALIRWAETGRITSYCQVRSTLLDRWDNAREFTFLQEIFERQLLEVQENVKPSLWGTIKARIRLRAMETRKTSGLIAVKAEDYDPAVPIVRFACGLTDALILLAYFVIVYLTMAFFYARGTGATAAFYLGFGIAYFGALMYFPWMISFHSQTVGQKFWGVVVMRTADSELYLGRAFVYTIALLMFGIFTPFAMFVFPSGRAIQDVVSGTRVVRTKLVPKR